MAKSRSIRTWIRASHRWLGVLLLLPLTIVCITGLILNHTVDLKLSSRKTSVDWIQARYGMHLQGEPEAMGFDGKAYAATWDGKIFYQKQILEDTTPLIGAVPLRDGTAVVTASAVHYFGLDGELIETLDSLTLPGTPISRSGRTRDLELVLETPAGTFISDENLLEFTKADTGREIDWSGVVTAKESDLETWKSAFSGDGIPLDRLILDLHSGRFFGTVGKWIYDLATVGVLLLSATGFVLFLRTRRRAA